MYRLTKRHIRVVSKQAWHAGMSAGVGFGNSIPWLVRHPVLVDDGRDEPIKIYCTLAWIGSQPGQPQSIPWLNSQQHQPVAEVNPAVFLPAWQRYPWLFPQAPPPSPSPIKPFVARWTSIDPVRRLERFTELVSTLLNSLFGQGYLVQTGIATYKITSGAITATRSPGPNDDASIGANPGTIWVDQSAVNVYICVSNSLAAAVWKGPV